jgi:TrmH family RNA methyltransferase
MTAEITSLKNPRIKSVLGLRDVRQRQETGCFLIDGRREIGRALDAGIDVIEAFVCAELVQNDADRALLERLSAGAFAKIEVTAHVMDKIAFGDRAGAALLVARVPQRSLDALRLSTQPLIAVVEGLEKPGNLGAILRSADGAGVEAVLVADPRCDLFNPNVIRASLGIVFSLPVVAAESEQILSWLRTQQITPYAARLQAAEDYAEVDWQQSAAIVLGSEAAGLSAHWTTPEIQPIRIPMLGVADSLNVSVAAAVLFYEARRQRNSKTGR